MTTAATDTPSDQFDDEDDDADLEQFDCAIAEMTLRALTLEDRKRIDQRIRMLYQARDLAAMPAQKAPSPAEDTRTPKELRV